MALAGGVAPHHIASYINAEAKLLLKYGVSTLPVVSDGCKTTKAVFSNIFWTLEHDNVFDVFS